jgi:diguanylate cyclase (GGDEF)-like protein
MRHSLVPEVKRALARSVEESRRPWRPVEAQSAMDRLCRVLDDLLFDAVLASEVRQLVNVPDRKTFARSIIELASDVVTYAYLLVRLTGPKESTFVVHARDPWPDDESRALRMVGVPESADVETIATGPTGPDVELAPGEHVTFPIRSGDENMGELIVFSGTKPFGTSDRSTLTFLARELGTAAKTQFLMEQTKLLALTDPLTGLFNRRHTSSVLEQEVARANRYGTPLTLVMCDIDHFKSVNDRFGHNVGDEVIRQVAGLLPERIRRIDLAGRWGGEEFILILPSTATEGAYVVAERIRSAVEVLCRVDGGLDHVTVSLGVAEHRRSDKPIELVERADKALYAAKQRGRNCVEVSVTTNGAKVEDHRDQV